MKYYFSAQKQKAAHLANNIQEKKVLEYWSKFTHIGCVHAPMWQDSDRKVYPICTLAQPSLSVMPAWKLSCQSLIHCYTTLLVMTCLTSVSFD